MKPKIERRSRRYSEVLDRKQLDIADKALALMLGLIVTIMFFQVFFRYVLNNSLTWTEEIIRFLFIWVIFLGTALNIRDRWNIGVDLISNILPESAARSFRLLDLILVLGFLIFLSVSGFIWVYYSRGAYSSAVELPLNLVLYGALPFTSVLGCYYSIVNIRQVDKPEVGG